MLVATLNWLLGPPGLRAPLLLRLALQQLLLLQSPPQPLLLLLQALPLLASLLKLQRLPQRLSLKFGKCRASA